jgi:hypothetical protein
VCTPARLEWRMRRTMFYVYLAVIFGGLAYFIAIGLLRT